MQSLKNQFLIAMPSLAGSIFEHAVIYLCDHDDNGAMGLMVNRTLDISLGQLLNQVVAGDAPAEGDERFAQPVLLGGPVNPERGFVLHSPNGLYESSVELSDTLSLTTSRDVLLHIATERAPKQFLVALGYSGWSEGQLEQELADNSWLVLEGNNDLLFNCPSEQLWFQALQRLGIDWRSLSSEIGHA